MRIACPACSAAYDVPDDRVRPGRVVRCARCSATWTPVDEPIAAAVLEPEQLVPVDPASSPLPGPAIPDPDPVVMPAPIPADALIEQTVIRAPRSRMPLALAWLLSAVLLAAMIGAGIVWRDSIMLAWPPSQRAFAAIGLGP